MAVATTSTPPPARTWTLVGIREPPGERLRRMPRPRDLRSSASHEVVAFVAVAHPEAHGFRQASRYVREEALMLSPQPWIPRLPGDELRGELDVIETVTG